LCRRGRSRFDIRYRKELTPNKGKIKFMKRKRSRLNISITDQREGGAFRTGRRENAKKEEEEIAGFIGGDEIVPRVLMTGAARTLDGGCFLCGR